MLQGIRSIELDKEKIEEVLNKAVKVVKQHKKAAMVGGGVAVGSMLLLGKVGTLLLMGAAAVAGGVTVGLMQGNTIDDVPDHHMEEPEHSADCECGGCR